MVEDAVLNPEGAFMLFDDGLAYKHELDDSTKDGLTLGCEGT